MPLTEQHRQKLDGIVQQMLSNGEPDENVQFVVDDFKKKYGGAEGAAAPQSSASTEKVATGAQALQSADQNSVLGRAAGAGGRMLYEGAKSLGQAILHPMDTANAIMADSSAEDAAAREANRRGDTLGTLQHSVQSVPVIGPTIRGALDRLRKGEIPELAGEIGATTFAPKALSAVVKDAVGVAPQSISSALKESAVRQYSKVLNATKEANKYKSARVVPEMIDRGIMSTSLKGLNAKVAREVARVGQAIGDAWDNLPSGSMVGADDVLATIKKNATEAYTIPDASGARIPMGKEAARALKNTEALTQTIEAVAEKNPATGALEVPADKMRKLRQFFDQVAKDAGSYQGKNLKDITTGAAHEAAANAIREELGKTFPYIAALNKEFNFWKNINEVLDATILRREGQAKPLGRKMAGAAGAAAGFGTGGMHGAVMGKAALEALEAATASPAWQTISAVLKDRLAKAIAKGNQPQIEFYVRKAAGATRAAAMKPPSLSPAASRLVADKNNRGENQ